MTPNKPPLAMTIHEMFQRLTLVLEKSTHEERERFKQSWLGSAYWFNAETEWRRQERSKARLSDDHRESG